MRPCACQLKYNQARHADRQDPVRVFVEDVDVDADRKNGQNRQEQKSMKQQTAEEEVSTTPHEYATYEVSAVHKYIARTGQYRLKWVGYEPSTEDDVYIPSLFGAESLVREYWTSKQGSRQWKKIRPESLDYKSTIEHLTDVRRMRKLRGRICGLHLSSASGNTENEVYTRLGSSHIRGDDQFLSLIHI